MTTSSQAVQQQVPAGDDPALPAGTNSVDLTEAFAALRASAEKILQHKKQIEQLNSWFQIALDNMARGLSMFDAQQRLIVCNKLYRKIYDLPVELSVPGTPLADIVRFHVMQQKGNVSEKEIKQQREWIDAHMAELAQGKSFSYVQNLPNGRTILVTIQPLADGGWVDLQEDITEKQRAEQKISWLAHHDTLTQIANRFHFREMVEQELKTLQPDQRFALLWVDLDKFKPVNDTLGHPVGDELLKAVANRLRKTVRSHDIVGRLGGDEFAILQRGCCNVGDAEKLAKRLVKTISQPFSIDGHTVHVNGSIGIAIAPEHGRTVDMLFANADLALYEAKSAGGHRYVFHTA